MTLGMNVSLGAMQEIACHCTSALYIYTTTELIKKQAEWFGYFNDFMF